MELQHFSHPHPLHQSLVQQEEKELNCSGCEVPLSGSIYSCTPCNFFLHEWCSKRPDQIQHLAHPAHPLTLQTAPTYESGSFTCEACGEDGRAFSFTCNDCKFDLHLQCGSLPGIVTHESHPHNLTLTFGIPSNEPRRRTTLFCDVCDGMVDREYWAYYCALCHFATHLNCAGSSTEKQRPESDDDHVNDGVVDQLESAGADKLSKVESVMRRNCEMMTQMAIMRMNQDLTTAICRDMCNFWNPF